MALELSHNMPILPLYSAFNSTTPAHPWPDLLTTQSASLETSLSFALNPT